MARRCRSDIGGTPETAVTWLHEMLLKRDEEGHRGSCGGGEREEIPNMH